MKLKMTENSFMASKIFCKLFMKHMKDNNKEETILEIDIPASAEGCSLAI